MDVPDNLKNQLNVFRSKMSSLKSDCQALLHKYDSIRENIDGNALEEASLDLAAAFTINSLFWIYLTCKGLDTKNHDLKLEINRIKLANMRLKKLKDSAKAPKLDVPAAQRFIRHSLFDPKDEVSERTGKVSYDYDGDDDDNNKRKRKRLEEEVGDVKMEQGDDHNEESEDDEDDEDKVETNEDKTSLVNEGNKGGLNVRKRGKRGKRGGGSEQEEKPADGSTIADHKGKRRRNTAKEFFINKKDKNRGRRNTRRR